MSADALPISSTRFASALTDLPVESIYAKYSELRNSITHMESSNKQLEDFARENDDRDCYEALLENRQVITRFLERIDLLKKEVTEVRGLPWRPQDEEEERKVEAVPARNGTAAAGAAQEQRGAEAQSGEAEEGVFL